LILHTECKVVRCQVPRSKFHESCPQETSQTNSVCDCMCGARPTQRLRRDGTGPDLSPSYVSYLAPPNDGPRVRDAYSGSVLFCLCSRRLGRLQQGCPVLCSLCISTFARPLCHGLCRRPFKTLGRARDAARAVLLPPDTPRSVMLIVTFIAFSGVHQPTRAFPYLASHVRGDLGRAARRGLVHLSDKVLAQSNVSHSVGSVRS
jgi:hypothetical protein